MVSMMVDLVFADDPLWMTPFFWAGICLCVVPVPQADTGDDQCDDGDASD